MGSKKGGGAQTPYEAPNTLNSAQNLRIIDAICEGEIAGFANGDDAPFKSIFFNDTPVQNADGSFNFNGVAGYFQVGSPDQSYIPSFDATERTVSVSASVKQNSPIIRAISDKEINRLRVTVGVERNMQIKDNGDSVPATTQLVVELVNQSGVQATQTVTFTEKGSSAFYQDVAFDSLPAVPFNLRVRRVTPDSKDDKTSNGTFFASYVEIIDAKLSYPNTALAALKIDSDQFGNSIPRRNYLLKGKLIQVPSNYDPITRQYSGSLWDGSFKTAWSNNPAWVFYDLLTNPRYSTLAHRVGANDVDKWALYQIGKYCDELVDDGFGGQEPRYVCNAYITDQRQAADLLQDLASAFCGLSVWNGNQISVLADTHRDPVAHYSNANVVNGKFDYAGASLKNIHTAVHVKYADKYDGYRAKVEYIADNQSIARYGLNVKQVTAFGCDSRGQAVRFGRWILETELRQQHSVSFTVGREGLKHLPYDIIQIADNDYAGAQIGGRVVAVSGSQITLDRDVVNAVGAMFYYTDTVSGSLKSVKITAQLAKNRVEVATAIALQPESTWAMSGRVKTRLYRALSIAENINDGTYRITALRHDPEKYGVVDTSAIFDNAVNTLHTTMPELNNADVATDNGDIVVSWDNLSADGAVLDYDIKLYRNNVLYRHLPNNPTAEVRFEQLPNGDYRVEIRARNARGVYTKPLIKAWSINYTITGLRTTAKTFAIDLTWTLPALLAVAANTEVWYGTENNIQAARKLATLPTPQNSYTLTGVAIADRYYFWVRLVDVNGNTGEFTASVLGQADPNPAPIVAQIQGAITKSTLSQALIAQLQADDLAAENRAKADAAAKIAAEANARATAIRAETTARTAAITAAADTAAQNLRTEVGKLNTAIATAANQAQANLTAKTDELIANATALGNRITSAENVNAQQATAIQAVTAAQNATAAALEVEKKARADGDKAEAAQRATLAAKVSQNTAAIAAETQARTTAQAAEAQAREALAARVATAESGLTAERQARADADSATNRALNAATARLGTAESNIGTLQQGLATQQQALAQSTQTMTAKIDNLQVGGRNYADDGDFSRGYWEYSTYATTDRQYAIEQGIVTVTGLANGWKQFQLFSRTGTRIGRVQQSSSLHLIESGEWVLSFDARVVSGSPNIWVQLRENRNGMTHVNRMAKTFVLTENWQRFSFSQSVEKSENFDFWRIILGYSEVGVVQYRRIKLEKGNIGTDWSPAPEDLETSAAATQAELTAFKEAQATVDAAQTSEINAAKSQIGAANSAIEQIRSTKAEKAEVGALARTTLQSEWRSDVQAAENRAKSAAATDAQSKADAAKAAAIAAADTAAQAKADAAKAAAVAESVNTAQSKADAAKAAAIADAAAKDAIVKQQAATDAQSKADAAKTAAIAEANRLNTATNAKITALEQTVTLFSTLSI